MSRRTPGIDLAKALGRREAERAPAAPAGGGTAAQDRPGAPARGARAPSRTGQTNVSGWFDMHVKLRMDELRVARQRALGRRVTQQELLSEALSDLFRKHGLPELAPGGSDR